MAIAHQHDDVEFNLSRTDTLYLIDGRTVAIPAGQLALFWASRPHQLLTETGATEMSWATVPLVQFLSWSLPTAFVARLLGGQVFRYGGEPARLFERFAEWSSDLASGSHYAEETVRLELHALSRRVATSIEHDEAAQPHAASSTGLPARMAAYIAEHSATQLTIDDVAASVHIHPKYAMALFRREIGITIGTYITQCRVARAQDLLLTTRQSVAAVALEAGFQSQTQFHDRFKASCGMSPAAYRRQHLSS
jgi:AraC-like DNA-binding protein